MKSGVVLFCLLVLSGCGSETLERLGRLGELNEGEVASGLKEALTIGSDNASTRLNRLDAYYLTPAIRIPFPPDAKKVETTLRNIGYGSLVDDAILSLNRAAEKAAIKAKPIFLLAIRDMTITDAITILNGSNDEATVYLRRKTLPSLVAAFRPPIASALDDVNATRYWANIMTIYNQIPLVEPVNTDLAGFVTTKALDGLFLVVAGEETKIRTDPAARVTELLRRVFGRQPK